MITPKLIEEIIATYRRHEWQLQRVLLRAATRASIGERETVFDLVHVRDSDIDALWFSRPPNQGREAWELRMIAEQQYALFEAFEPDATEEQREEVRREMEARMREHLAL
ncbi:MAG: hypothetical protein DMF71_06220 [Acidobacteria bacterium]|nr:MAG: hypothetical protein DMF71_06220 [Acidobacteriota bacterium]